jgi:exodeoxyribonuclease V gamma subunit
LQALTAQLTGVHEVGRWLELLRDAIEQLADVPRGEEWQFAQAHRELAALGRDATTGATLELRLSDVRALLHRQLAGRPTRASFRTGTLTVCTMTPMRAVPHRVVCLLGLDDGVFPRGGAIDGDDVLARLPRVGERDVRSEDRQLFLDAIMSARQRLVITYTGFNESTGQPRPPSVPLREFLDVVERTAGAEVVQEHRSQAFHPDYLVPGRIHEHAPFSFDPDAASAARVAARERSRPVVLAELAPSPPPERGDVDLRDLVDVVTNPVRGFLRRRLQIDLPREEDQVSDAMPVELDGLATWQVGDRILHEVLRGRTPADACQAEWRRGSMPPGRYGWRQTHALAAATSPLVEMFESATQGVTPQARDLAVDLGDGRRLTGTVTGLYDNRLVRVAFSRLRAKQRLEAWISLVALSAAHPGHWVARAIGRGEADAPARATYSHVEDPMPVLTDLVALHDLAMTRVLPLCPDTGRKYAETADSTRPRWMIERDLKDQWRKESASTDLVTAWGRRPSWEDLVAAPSTEGAEHLFGELAVRLWRPALAREQE